MHEWETAAALFFAYLAVVSRLPPGPRWSAPLWAAAIWVGDTLENTNAVLASRNNPKLHFVDALHVNVYDVVNSRYIVLSQSALDRLTEALSNER